jgi:hypothetical protein
MKVPKFKRRYVLVAGGLIVGGAVVATILLVRHDHPSPSKTNKLPASLQAARKAVAAKLPKLPVNSAKQVPPASGNKPTSPSTTQAAAATIAEAQMTQAVKEGKLSKAQQAAILAEIATIKKYVATLSSTPSHTQDDAILQHEKTWQAWAAASHIPYHFIDPNIAL